MTTVGAVADPGFLFGGIWRRLKRDKCDEDKGGPGDGSAPVGSRGKAPVGDLGDEVPQKLLDFCELY